MRVVIQRVKRASVTIDGAVYNEIEQGYLVLVGFTTNDSHAIIEKVANKMIDLRIFEDENQKMNLSLQDVSGSILSISQFTLYANCKKGRRPSFDEALKGELSSPLYAYFNSYVESRGIPIKTGVFGADMKVELLNDGPVTIVLDSDNL